LTTLWRPVVELLWSWLWSERRHRHSVRRAGNTQDRGDPYRGWTQRTTLSLPRRRDHLWQGQCSCVLYKVVQKTSGDWPVLVRRLQSI